MPRLVTVALPETRCFAATVPEGLEVAVGTPCVVERGGAPELCRVRLVLDDADACPGPPPVTPPAHVLRCATDDDLARDAVNHQLGEQAMEQFDPSLVENQLIFPSDETLARAHVFRALTAEEETRYSDAFQTVIGN